MISFLISATSFTSSQGGRAVGRPATPATAHQALYVLVTRKEILTGEKN
jgi:hypothetical protein